MEGKVLTAITRAKRGLTAEQWLYNLIAYYIRHKENPRKFLYPSHKTDDEKRVLRNKRARTRRKAKKATP